MPLCLIAASLFKEKGRKPVLKSSQLACLEICVLCAAAKSSDVRQNMLTDSPQSSFGIIGAISRIVPSSTSLRFPSLPIFVTVNKATRECMW